jgi:hypothetical protein
MTLKRTAIALALMFALLLAGAWVAVRVLLGPERVRAAVEAQASAALGQPVRIGSASARIVPTVGLDLHDVNIPNTPTHLETVALETGLRPLFSRRVENARVTVSEGRIEIPWLIALLSALSEAPPPPAGSAAGFTVVSVRTIELRDLVLTAGARELRVNADGLYQEDRLEVSRLDATGTATTLTARGALASVSRMVGKFDVDAETLDLDALLALAGAATPRRRAGESRLEGSRGEQRGAGLSIEADVTAKTGRAAGIDFTNLSTHLRVTPSAARLDPLRLNAFQGKFDGRAIVNTAGTVPQTSVSGDAAEVRVGELAAFAGSPGVISGTLMARVAMTCVCSDLPTVLRATRANGRFEILNGEIPGLHLVREVVLAFGRPASDAPQSPGERFSRIVSTFNMAGGVLATDDLAFASPDFDMRARGTVSATTGAVNFKADVVLSPELSRQAGRDLVRYAHEGDRVILPATLSGTVASPRVFIDMEQALGRALKNELERRGRSLLDRLLKRKPGGD